MHFFPPALRIESQTLASLGKTELKDSGLSDIFFSYWETITFSMYTLQIVIYPIPTMCQARVILWTHLKVILLSTVQSGGSGSHTVEWRSGSLCPRPIPVVIHGWGEGPGRRGPRRVWWTWALFACHFQLSPTPRHLDGLFLSPLRLDGASELWVEVVCHFQARTSNWWCQQVRGLLSHQPESLTKLLF